MRKILLFAIIAGFVVACGGNEDGSKDAEKTTASAPAQPAADAPDGAKIYKINCIACHGLYGDMGASGAFNLQTSALNLEERIEVVTNGRNTMIPWKGILKEDEIKAVSEYTMTLKKEE